MSASKPRMVDPEQIKKAEALRAMHAGPEPLLLANVWDVASARIIEDAGFRRLPPAAQASPLHAVIPMARRFIGSRCSGT